MNQACRTLPCQSVGAIWGNIDRSVPHVATVQRKQSGLRLLRERDVATRVRCVQATSKARMVWTVDPVVTWKARPRWWLLSEGDGGPTVRAPNEESVGSFPRRSPALSRGCRLLREHHHDLHLEWPIPRSIDR